MIIRPINKSATDIEGLTILMNGWDDLVFELTRDYIEDKINKFLSLPNAEILIARTPAGEMTGYACLAEVIFLGMEPFIELQSILVREDHRGNGVGASLMEAAEKWTKEKGFSKIVLSSRIQLSKSHAFYRRLGYTVFKQSYYFQKEL